MSNTIFKSFYLIPFILLLFAGSIISLKAEEKMDIKPGMELETSKTVKLRASPPEQKWIFFVEKPGKETAKIEKGKVVAVEAIKNIKRPLSKDIWLKVKTKETAGSTKSGWVYYGSDKEVSNFKTE